MIIAHLQICRLYIRPSVQTPLNCNTPVALPNNPHCPTGQSLMLIQLSYYPIDIINMIINIPSPQCSLHDGDKKRKLKEVEPIEHRKIWELYMRCHSDTLRNCFRGGGQLGMN